jgi:hypothetical protein
MMDQCYSKILSFASNANKLSAFKLNLKLNQETFTSLNPRELKITMWMSTFSRVCFQEVSLYNG